MSAARRYLDKAKEAAEALKTAASLSAAEGEVSRLRVRLKESETELAQARAAGTEATDRLGALSLRFESSEAALHSAARVIQAALEDTLATLDPAVSDDGAPPLSQPILPGGFTDTASRAVVNRRGGRFERGQHG